MSLLEISMTVAQSSVPARKLISYWNDARLHVEAAKSASVRPAPGVVPWRIALEDVLKVGYGAQTQSRFISGAWERVRWRTTPSAGALYPYEVIAIVAGEGTWLWDIDLGSLVPCGLPPLTRDELAEAGFVTPPGRRLEAALVVVARPWLSMKKYRLRGYAYCHLDIGHVTTNLAIYATALGCPPAVHLRFSRAALAGRLQLGGLCREPLAALSFTSDGVAHPLPPASWTEPEHSLAPIRLELPEQREILNWESIEGILSFDLPVALPSTPAPAPLLGEVGEAPGAATVPLPSGRPLPSSAAEWRAAILGRRSAKGFREGSLSLAQLGELLGVLRNAGLPADCSGEGGARLGVRLVARNVEGVTGVFAYDPDGHALRRIDERADDPRPACMQQEMAADVAALVIFHAPLCSLVDRQGYSAFTELLFHAAELAQRLHLAAARLEGVGMTCIGGFDGKECATLARFDGEEEAVYVILLGAPDEAAVKRDRLAVAYSHGYTTQEG
jgi:hypothetical protein